jgi:hypothetical protein
MRKNLTAILALAGFLVINPRADAPIKNITYHLPIEKIISSESLEKYVKESEMKFLKSFYPTFPYPEEIPDILKHAQKAGLEPELLMAIRAQENGVDSLAYGVMHNGRIKERYENDKGYMDNGTFYYYKNEKEKQLVWAAETVKYYLIQFTKNPKNKDFISFLGKIYAPVGALNDPNGLNKYWIPRVKDYYKSFKRN